MREVASAVEGASAAAFDSAGRHVSVRAGAGAVGRVGCADEPTEGKLAAELFPKGQQVLIADSFHVPAVADEDHCASVIARNVFLNLNPRGR